MAETRTFQDKSEMDFALAEHGEELVIMFLKTSQRDLEHLTRAVASGMHEEAAQLAHRLTGSSAIMGFGTLAQLLSQLEQTAQSKNAAETGPLLKEVLKAYQRLVALRAASKTSAARP